MAIAESVLGVIEDECLQKNAQIVGDHLITNLKLLQNKHQCIGDVRGVGLYIGLELVKNRDTKEPAAELCKAIRHR